MPIPSQELFDQVILKSGRRGVGARGVACAGTFP